MVTFPNSTPAVAPSRGAVDLVGGEVTASPAAIDAVTGMAVSASIADRFGIAAPTPA